MDIALNNDEIRAIMQGNRLHAIQSLRGRTYPGLKEAKDIIENFMRDTGMVQETRCPNCQGRGVIENFNVQVEIRPS